MNLTAPRSYPGPNNIVRHELPNGIIVLAYENYSTPAVVLMGSLRAGSIVEMAAHTGLASLTTAALLRGTHQRDFDTLHSELEAMAATLGISAGTHMTTFSGKALAEDLPTLLTLFADVLFQPAFPTDQVERLRNETLSSLKIRQQNTGTVADELFRLQIYGTEHPYSRTLQQALDSVPQLTTDHMAAYHAQYLGPRGMIFVIVGALPAQQAIDIVSATLGSWENPTQPSLPTLPPLPALTQAQSAEQVLDGKMQSDMVLGWPGPSRLATDYYAASVANNVLGVFGMMGRLGKVVREEQGLAYHAASRLSGGLGPSPWAVTAGVNPANVGQALVSIQAEIARLCETPITAEELRDSVAYFVGRMPLSLESSEGIAATIHTMEVYQLGLDYLWRYPAILNTLTPQDVQQAVQRYISPTVYGLGIAGPARR